MKPRGDRPHLRYLFAKQDYFQYRRAMKTLSNSVRFEASDPAQFRLKVLEYYHRWGLRPTLDAFNVSRTSVFRWQQHYRHSGHQLTSLIPQSTRPKRVRQMTTDYRLIRLIKQLREDQGNVGSHLLKPFVDTYATSLGISSIEKVIKRYHFVEQTSVKYQRKSVLKRLRNKYAPKVNEPGFIQMDSITVLINNHRLHFMSVIDIFTKFAFVRLVDRQQARNAVVTFQGFEATTPTPIHTIQTDNGSEFLGVFDQYLHAKQFKHVFIYPHSPRINGVVERFNRTIQQEFINKSDEIYFDLPTFEGKLQKYLEYYNTHRLHAALHYQAPLQFIHQSPKCP